MQYNDLGINKIDIVRHRKKRDDGQQDLHCDKPHVRERPPTRRTSARRQVVYVCSYADQHPHELG